MKIEREIIAYKNYFWDFMATFNSKESRKVYYILDMLKTQERISEKFVNSTLTDSLKIEKSIRFTLNPEGNRIDFSDFSPWGRGKKSEKLVFFLNLLK